ncbi:MAG TPA: DMT family transporter [Gammaproteobacteria bacterium]
MSDHMTPRVSTSGNKWLLLLAYLAVVLIWSTTPIAIKWSSDGVSFVSGLALRMLIGVCLASVLVLLLYKKIVFNRNASRVYMAAALALYGGMMPVYWGAQYIPSGLVSVIFGITPIVTGYLAWRYIHEASFSGMKILGALAGMLGLAVIFIDSRGLGEDYFYGVAAVLLAVLLHSGSAVWVKSIRCELPPLMLVAGGLLYSMPLFIISYLLLSPGLPDTVPVRTLASITYLGVVGSVLGFVCYYYLLRHLQTSTVALITLITPVTALWIGFFFNNESMSLHMYVGTGFVLLGLGLHQWGATLYRLLCREL